MKKKKKYISGIARNVKVKKFYHHSGCGVIIVIIMLFEYINTGRATCFFLTFFVFFFPTRKINREVTFGGEGGGGPNTDVGL